MSSDLAIRLRQVSKSYPLYDRPSQKLAELLTLRRRRFHREFWALRNIDLEVPSQTTLGIVGPNGSGKSTLLQIVAGILQQSEGDCVVEGNVAALLELGAGFNPEFTGRENVFMNGAINGIRKQEMEERFDDIVDFAEIGPFIDRPVKTYSSGMFVRLAFAVAIHVDPDILLVDEALSVGDLIFQHRCINRIRQMKRDGKTILFVTHDLQALAQFCDRAILLDEGELKQDGTPEKVIHAYHALIFDRERKRAGQGEDRISLDEDQALPIIRTVPYVHNRFGEGNAEIIGVILHTPDGRVVSDVRSGEQLNLLVTVRFRTGTNNPIIGVTFRDRMGMEVCATNTSYEGISLPSVAPGEIVTVGFDWTVPNLRPGSYSISPGAARGNIWEHTVEDWIDNAYIFNVVDTGLVYGLMRVHFDVRYRRFLAEVGEPDR
jgi:ABC-type polysaccharide/polyol phosphate transport system ATPase subunit